MTRATLVQWLLPEGSAVAPGTALAEIETEKAVFAVEADAAGVLLRQLVAAGERVPVGTPIAVIGAVGEVVSEVAPAAPVSADRAEIEAAPGLAIDEEYDLDYREALL